MMQQTRFEVGEKYENMKGVFEVISMGKDSMNIRWEGGEEISTPIDLQLRIIERLRQEKALETEEVVQKSKKGKAPAAEEGKEFEGLEENDFSDLVSKTTWRGRSQIGGAVTRLMKTKQYHFNSWVVARKPEVRWLDLTRQKQEDVSFQVKFYAMADVDSMCFGLQVPAVDPSNSGRNDWHALLKWLDRQENDSWLLKQCATQGLRLFDGEVKGFTGTLEAEADQWVHRSEKKERPVKSLSAFFRGLDNMDKIELHIEKKLTKDDAMEKRQGIVDDIAGVFNNLMPLYEAAVTLN